MNAVTFDTFRVVRRLVSSGMPEAQAEQVVDAVIDAMSEVATNSDLKALEYRLTINIGGMFVAAFGLFVSLFKGWL